MSFVDANTFSRLVRREEASLSEKVKKEMRCGQLTPIDDAPTNHAN